MSKWLNYVFRLFDIMYQLFDFDGIVDWTTAYYPVFVIRWLFFEFWLCTSLFQMAFISLVVSLWQRSTFNQSVGWCWSRRDWMQSLKRNMPSGWPRCVADTELWCGMSWFIGFKFKYIYKWSIDKYFSYFQNDFTYDFIGLAALIIGFRFFAFVALVFRTRSKEWSPS